MKQVVLKVKHCEQALTQDLLICTDGIKKFTFHVWQNEYRVWVKEKGAGSPLWPTWVIKDAGQALEELLNLYNDLPNI